MFDNTVEVGGPKYCSRTEGYSKEVSRRGAEACATMLNEGDVDLSIEVDKSAAVLNLKEDQILDFDTIVCYYPRKNFLLEGIIRQITGN